MTHSSAQSAERPILNRLQQFSHRPFQRFLAVLIASILPIFYLSWHLMLGRKSMVDFSFIFLWLFMTEIFCIGFMIDQGTDLFRRALKPEILAQLRLSRIPFQELISDVCSHLTTTMTRLFRLSLALQISVLALLALYDFIFSAAKSIPVYERIIIMSNFIILLALYRMGRMMMRCLGSFLVLQVVRNGVSIFALLPNLFSKGILALGIIKVLGLSLLVFQGMNGFFCGPIIIVITADLFNFLYDRLTGRYLRRLKKMDWAESGSISTSES